MNNDLGKNPPGLVFVNEAQVKMPNVPFFTYWGGTPRGFAHFPRLERPLLRHVKARGRKPLDLERIAAYWLVTGPVKAVFDAVDPQAFDFMACTVSYADGSPDEERWICDTVRELDALDETASNAQVYYDDDRKLYHLGGAWRMVFRDDAVGSAHVFRMAYASGTVICDDVMRQACKRAKLKGISFMDAVLKF